jgi:hypothetical protein
MKTTALFLICLFYTTHFSQDMEEKQKELTHGIQFQVARFLDLQSFFGYYSLSYRYLTANRSGFRISVSPIVLKADGDTFRQLDTLIISPPYTEKRNEFSISLQYLHSIMTYKNFDFIIGGGPSFSYQKSSRKYTDLEWNYITNRNNEYKYNYIRIDFIIGAEYRLTENVVFSGEYGVGISYGKFKSESVTITDYFEQQTSRFSRNVNEYNVLNISGTGAILGLAIFF